VQPLPAQHGQGHDLLELWNNEKTNDDDDHERVKRRGKKTGNSTIEVLKEVNRSSTLITCFGWVEVKSKGPQAAADRNGS